MRKICVITGSRAEYGIMSRLMRLIHDDPALQLQILATNMHLSPEFGLTFQDIEADGFHIDKKVEMLLSSDTAVGTIKSMGLALIGMADALNELKPDLAVILGDRYEMLAAAQACLIHKIPIAHLYGGEITEGAYDDSIRHAITKMSHLHFTSTEVYRKRVIQMGESPERVFNVGSLGVENVLQKDFMTKEDLENSLDFQLTAKCFLCTYHPVTLSNMSSEAQIHNLLNALDDFQDYCIIFTYSNSDTHSQIIIKQIQEYVDRNNERCMLIPSLGKKRYLSVLKHITAVIGNSSSGIIEVPSFGIPTLNIGDRQKGRIAANSVINCGSSIEEIKAGIKKIVSYRHKEVDNPYYKKGTSEAILQVIQKYPLENLVQKHFFDWA